jgi:hypothetical protein
MVAGVDKDARSAVEATVREALGARAASGPWSISVVSLAGKWSVTLDGPGDRLRGLSFMAERHRLADAIREAVGDAHDDAAHGPTAHAPAASGAATPGPAGSPTEARDQHACERCGKGVVVVYEVRPGDGRALAPIACPHCWSVGHVEIGAWAAAGHEYRAEKA